MGHTYPYSNGDYASGVALVADAQPPRPWLLGFIPLPRASSAYGYAQAKDETWDNYQDKAGCWGADRDEFSDATDFIGWYCSISYTRLGISKLDAKKLIPRLPWRTRWLSTQKLFTKGGTHTDADKVASVQNYFKAN